MICAAWDRVPLVASTVIEDVPTAAEPETEKVSDWLAPAPTEKGEEGEVVTPCGIPCSLMLTGLLKPFCAFTEIVRGGVVVPTETEEGEMEMPKSGVGGEGGAAPSPQLISVKAVVSSEKNRLPVISLLPISAICRCLQSITPPFLRIGVIGAFRADCTVSVTVVEWDYSHHRSGRPAHTRLNKMVIGGCPPASLALRYARGKSCSVRASTNKYDQPRRLLPGEAERELLNLRFQVLDFNLLRLDRFDQQGGQLGIVHALNLLGLWIAGDQFRNDPIDIFGHHADFVLPIGLALVGHALELFDLLQRPFERLDIGLETPRAARNPCVSQRSATSPDVKRRSRSCGPDADEATGGR